MKQSTDQILRTLYLDVRGNQVELQNTPNIYIQQELVKDRYEPKDKATTRYRLRSKNILGFHRNVKLPFITSSWRDINFDYSSDNSIRFWYSRDITFPDLDTAMYVYKKFVTGESHSYDAYKYEDLYIYPVVYAENETVKSDKPCVFGLSRKRIKRQKREEYSGTKYYVRYFEKIVQSQEDLQNLF